MLDALSCFNNASVRQTQSRTHVGDVLMKPTRRSFLACATLLPALISRGASAQSDPAIHVVKGRGCGCCAAWVEILKAEGFSVTDEMRHPVELVKLKMDKGIPQKMFSCHTAMIDDYITEGHVPPTDIRRLIAQKPDALGLAVPEMPYGSPGMGPEDEREAFDVFLFRKDGSSTVFSHYDAAA